MPRINVKELGSKVIVDGKEYDLLSLTGVKTDIIKYEGKLYRKVKFGNPDIYSQMPNVDDIVYLNTYENKGYYKVSQVQNGGGLVAIVQDDGERALYSCSHTVNSTYKMVD